MIKTLPLEGLESYWAAQAYIKLLLGLKMLPSYLLETYEQFYGRIEIMDQSDKENMLREAVMHVSLLEDEVLQVVKFAADQNGVRFTKVNMQKLTPDQILEIIIAVILEISKIKIKFVSESEKKNLIISQ